MGITGEVAKTAAAVVAVAMAALGGGEAHADPAHHSALAGVDMPADATLQSTDDPADGGGGVIKSELWKYSGSYDATVNYFKARMPHSFKGPDGGSTMKQCPTVFGDPGPYIGNSVADWSYSNGMLLLDVQVHNDSNTLGPRYQRGILVSESLSGCA
jgi:hypothetical protein